MENSPALWWMKDSAGHYIFVNSSFAKFWQITIDEIVGKTDFDFMPQKTADTLTANDRIVLETQKTIHIHEFVEGPSGERIFLTVKFPFSEQGTSLVAGIGFDVSEARKAQLQLEHAHDQALEAASLKSAFLSSIQHEIRTPLAGIIGMNELLLTSQLDQDQRHLATTVQESSEALLTVLNDILDLSKIEAGRLGLRTVAFNLRFIFDESIRLLSAAARSKGLSLNHTFDEKIPKRVVGDPERLRQVLLNLLGNAVKFTHVGWIESRADLIGTTDDTTTIRFTVKDSGIGIAPEKQPYLFLPFWQAEMGDARRFGGPGLGLPLSKHIIEKMGSDGIHVESGAGKGSTFWFDIPFRKKGDGDHQSETLGDVLIVEDNQTLAASVMTEFESLGISSESVNTFAEATKRVQARQYQLVLCERILADGDALEFIERVRLFETQLNSRRTPIVVMSAAPTNEERKHYVSADADDVVQKPLSAERLWKLVNLWIL